MYSQVEETWIDGIRYYSKKENEILEERDNDLRKEILQKILSTNSKGGSGSSKQTSSSNHNRVHHCDSIDDSGIYHD